MYKVIKKIFSEYKKNSLGFIADTVVISLIALSALSIPVLPKLISSVANHQSQTVAAGNRYELPNSSLLPLGSYWQCNGNQADHYDNVNKKQNSANCPSCIGNSKGVVCNPTATDYPSYCGNTYFCKYGILSTGNPNGQYSYVTRDGKTMRCEQNCAYINGCYYCNPNGAAPAGGGNPPPAPATSPVLQFPTGPDPYKYNCVNKNCAAVQNCIKSYAGSSDTVCIAKNGGALNSYCGTPSGGPNSYVCGTGYCSPTTLTCIANPNTDGSNDDPEPPAAPGPGQTAPAVTLPGAPTLPSSTPHALNPDPVCGADNLLRYKFLFGGGSGATRHELRYNGNTISMPPDGVLGFPGNTAINWRIWACNSAGRTPTADAYAFTTKANCSEFPHLAGGNNAGGNTQLPPNSGGTNEDSICGTMGGVNTASGDKGYLGPRCGAPNNWQTFDAVKAADKAYCGLSYADAWQCLNGSIDYRNYGVGSGNTAYCSKEPWCPAGNTGGTNPGGGSTTQPQSCTQLGGTCMDNILYNGSACTPSTGGTGTRMIQQGTTGCTNPNPFCFVCQRTAVTPVPNNPGVTIATTQSPANGSGETCAISGTICGGNNSNACYAAKDATSLHCCRFTERFCTTLGKCVAAGTPEFENCGKPQSSPKPTNQSCYPDNPATNHCYNGHADCCNPSTRGVYAGKSFQCTSAVGTGTSYCVETSAQNTQQVSSASECTKNSDCKNVGKNICVLNAHQTGICE